MCFSLGSERRTVCTQTPQVHVYKRTAVISNRHEDAVALRWATSSEDYQAFGRLCRDYVTWCRLRYKDVPWLVDEVFGYQALDEELKILSRKYGPPQGRILLAIENGEVVGGGAFKRWSDSICELKRLYVSEAGQGRGLGRTLCEALLASARSDGFNLIRLDTGNLMSEAMALYSSMGFKPCPPYQVYPEKIRAYLVFMEKAL